MARPINLLSARFVATTKKAGLHSDGGGLYLEVDEGGSKRWTFIWRSGGRRRQMGLGGTLTTDLAEAREMANAARRQIAKGLDPIAERKAARTKGRTFGQAADDLLASLQPEWRNDKHAYQWKYSLETLAASLRPLAVDAITTADVLAALKPIWTTTPETASRTRGRIERVLDAERAAGNRTGENPARWKGHLAALLPKRQKLTKGHHPAMPFEQVGDFMPLLRSRPALSARALEFVILTAARTNEVLGARRAEFDMDKRVWTVPAERMKLGVDHRVPLSSRAVVLLEGVFADMPDPDGLVFADAKGDQLSDAAMSRLLRVRMGFSAFSVHGFRSTFRDWAGEATTFPEAVAEAALSHQVGTEVERAYKRGDVLEKRRKMMEAWASYCDRPKAGNVVDMRRA
ncbi:site-specific integrase [Brevundimonas sp. S30B]|uniref:tyrosine-type recombinase/integrase n=1 Tax=unclassified Brevundimonas TaxID=2622653 RepID=UPI001071F738|nr:MULTISPECIES: site-specific integrase [unclassified Brevundimonas]QBX37249.1 site-specific integrase [Brevundimonas sp. MF30-B]TFW03958.1 site-specific integrase [Brevundimonas sp. S30B]